jgi:hypothetical protein
MNTEKNAQDSAVVESASSHFSRPVLKQVAELNRKLVFNLNTDTPANITFRDSAFTEDETQRIYFLASNYQTRENTLKYVDIRSDSVYDQLNGEQLMSDYTALFGDDKSSTLTKEEQLLRERQRCSHSGITAYFLDHASNRLLFSDRSELFYFDDRSTSDQNVSLF